MEKDLLTIDVEVDVEENPEPKQQPKLQRLRHAPRLLAVAGSFGDRRRPSLEGPPLPTAATETSGATPRPEPRRRGRAGGPAPTWETASGEARRDVVIGRREKARAGEGGVAKGIGSEPGATGPARRRSEGAERRGEGERRALHFEREGERASDVQKRRGWGTELENGRIFIRSLFCFAIRCRFLFLGLYY